MASPPVRTGPLSVLFLCTHNSARSQIAEALLTRKADRVAPGRFVAGSAGSSPGKQVHPGAVHALASIGIDWSDHQPKTVDAVAGRDWDLIVTVCDRAKETCPVFPGRPAFAHWGMDDPSDAIDGEKAFADTVICLGRRIDLLLALPFESLERLVLGARVQAIAEAVPIPNAPAGR